jgi:serine protease
VAVALAAAPASAQSDVDDPLRPEQYALDLVGAPNAWLTSTGEGVVIAVLDTGVDLEHPDLQGRLLAGRDLVDGDDEPDDDDGHGTHVAGIAAAATNNGEGIAGTAPGAMLLPIRVLDAAGEGSAGVLARGIRWATEHDADVILVTVAGDRRLLRRTGSGRTGEAVVAAAEDGAVVVTAATPGRGSNPGAPLLVVTAADRDGHALASNPTAGPHVVAGPGAGVLSTAPVDPSRRWPQGTDGYEELTGTPMAAAAVAGVAALLSAEGQSSQEIRDLLTATASNPEGDARLGAGIVDAPAAVEQAAGATAGGSGGAVDSGGSGGIPPALVGALAISGALLAVGIVLAAAGRSRLYPDD